MSVGVISRIISTRRATMPDLLLAMYCTYRDA